MTEAVSGSPALAGHHAFITGGGSGIGLGAARAFVADGAHVTLCGRTRETLEAAQQELGDAASIMVADVADADAQAAAIDAANDYMPLTIAVANAGRGGASPVLLQDIDDWNSVLATNVTGALLTFKHAGIHLAANGGGAMCAVSSIAGSQTHRFMTSYNVSKAALEMMVRNTADELGGYGIRVNAVAPGLIKTDISATLHENPEIAADYRRNSPLGRQGTAEDCGEAIRFLCGPESSYITGAVVPVDGGQHLRRGPALDSLFAPHLPDLPPVSHPPKE